jgi:hypothetical protein
VLKVLAADGKTLIEKGGTALEIVNEKGDSIERADLTPVDLDGKEIKKVESSFNAPNELKKAEVDDYLGIRCLRLVNRPMPQPELIPSIISMARVMSP